MKKLFLLFLLFASIFIYANDTIPYQNAKEFLEAEKLHGPYVMEICDNNKTYYYKTIAVLPNGACFDTGRLRSVFIPWKDLLNPNTMWCDSTICGKIQ